MSAESKNLPTDFADQLASFDNMLHATTDDVEMLSTIEAGIGELLKADGRNEAHIRKILNDRYEAGSMRKETYQLVKSVLDHFVCETVPTSPTERTVQVAQSRRVTPIATANDKFAATIVIPDELAPQTIKETLGPRQVQVGSVLRDRFMLQEEITGGSMGVVYKAMDRRLAEAGSKDHWVAIKILSPQLADNAQALRALQQEAAKGRCLVHPNIVRFLDMDRDGDLYFLVMEWLEGRTLADILDSSDAKSINRAAAFKIVHQIGDAVDHAHRCGIIHADIKPGNIMISPDGDAKLFDFGVARVRQQQTEVDFDPGVLGAITPAYSSLQVLTGEEPVASDDVFSLSCLFYRLIAGYRVFGPRDAAQASQEGMSAQRLTTLSDAQWKTVKKGLAYARVMRFDSVRAFLDQLGDEQSVFGAGDEIHIDVPERFESEEENSSVSKTLLVLLLLLSGAVFAAYKVGYLQPLIDRIETSIGDGFVTELPEDPANDVSPVIEELEVAPVSTDVESVEEEVFETLPEPAYLQEEVVGPSPMLVDFAVLQPADREFSFDPESNSNNTHSFTIREDAGDVVVDFVRTRSLNEPLRLRLEEIGFSGNRSPWIAGQFNLSNAGMIELPVGQERGRIVLSMASDSRREADQVTTLRLRDADFIGSKFAVLNVTLEDDDRREIETQISANVVGLSESQMTVSESDPVVQLELVRFNPNNQPLTVEFSVIELTAKEGSDFFTPSGHTVTFGPNERTARLLIPLVQDSEIEGDEAFIVALSGRIEPVPVPVIREVIIMIEDDEQQ